MSQSIYIFVEHAVNWCYISGHISIPWEVPAELSLIWVEDKFLRHGPITSNIFPHSEKQQPDLKGREMGESFVDIGQHGRQKLALPHAGD